MVGRAVLETSYWPAEAGEVRDITVCETLHHAAATVPDRLALVDCVPHPAARLYPAEIEAALQDHPAIETAVVIGVPDEKWENRWPRSCACGLMSPGPQSPN